MSSTEIKFISIGIIIGLILGISVGYTMFYSKISNLNSEQLILRQTIVENENKINELNNSLRIYSEELNYYQEELSKKETTLNQLSQELENIQTESDDLILSYKVLEEKYQQLEEELEKYAFIAPLDKNDNFTCLNFTYFEENDPGNKIQIFQDKVTWTELDRSTPRYCIIDLNFSDPNSFIFDFEFTLTESHGFNRILEIVKLFNLYSEEFELTFYTESLSSSELFNVVFHQYIREYDLNTFVWISRGRDNPLIFGETYYARIIGDQDEYRLLIWRDILRRDIVIDSGIIRGRKASYSMLYMPQTAEYKHDFEPWSSGKISNLKFASP
jgi:hypothetical protein